MSDKMCLRLGRLLTGGARGPGVFFIIPCVDIYEKIDLRTATYEIPPQEVSCQGKPLFMYAKERSAGEGTLKTVVFTSGFATEQRLPFIILS